jgi:carbon-monoxide dehydrogenase medium subunit
MKPAPFTLHRPTTIDEAVAVLAAHGDEAKVLAGGQSLVPLLAMRLARFDHLVDVNGIAELTGTTVDGTAVRVGAATRQRVLERDPRLGEVVPLLNVAAPLIGHFQVRNRGTVGGSLAHADPAAELPAVATTLDSTLEVRGPAGTRSVGADAFFDGPMTTTLADDELLVAVRFPVRRPGSGFAIEEVARRHGDFALAGAVAAVQLDGRRVAHLALTVFAASGRPQRLTDLERALTGVDVGEIDVDAVAADAAGATETHDDAHASGRFRRSVAAVLVARALRTAFERAEEGP